MSKHQSKAINYILAIIARQFVFNMRIPVARWSNEAILTLQPIFTHTQTHTHTYISVYIHVYMNAYVYIWLQCDLSYICIADIRVLLAIHSVATLANQDPLHTNVLIARLSHSLPVYGRCLLYTKSMLVCSTSLMASLIRSVACLLKYFYQALWLLDLNTEVIGQSINIRGLA